MATTHLRRGAHRFKIGKGAPRDPRNHSRARSRQRPASRRPATCCR